MNRGVRFNSSAPKINVAGIQGKINSAVAKATHTLNSAIYWSKVVGQLAKKVYIKEGLAPPAIADFQAVYKKLYAQALAIPANRVQIYKTILDAGAGSVAKKGAVVGVQIFGLFALGEAIGRGHLMGYSDHAHHA
ncbi:hypothetical protein BABINDRAFT_35584 [Babjeviella inositovora NRRL Y-12698]|uniref:ATP synthase subunit g, mitochondrial n=1 Tax=Babjeviella inositovora NRRL Y-12698 TaxID=984486 RepID=A0A1E3QRL7_9ASCO|nr:uncharacterized protein BABINDRAFT_35584 [Babjeviella inositovora NRRL Y-12698]ODQ80134.1 hypothetical protein BABINDRAFT_35584 [Babjeviella inositovora NRRL Y-12698]